MDISLTVIDARSGVRADVAVAASDDTAVDEILTALAAAVGQEGDLDVPASVDGAPVDPAATVAQSGFREGSVVVLGAAPLLTREVPLLELRVVGGPGAGDAITLTEGVRIVGRGSECDLRLSDPAISRRHLLVEVSASGTSVTDIGSANGTSVNGVSVGRSAAPLAAGAMIRLGGTLLAVGCPADPPADVRRDGVRLQVNRPPRLRPPAEPVRVELPAAPQPRQKARISALAVLAPLALGVVLAVVVRQWQYLLFTAMSPVLVLAQAVSDRRFGRRSDLRDRRAHDQAMHAAQTAIDTAVAADQRCRRDAAPDLAAVRATAEGPRARLWERRPTDDDFLVLRVGFADLTSTVEVVAPPGVAPVPPPVVTTVPVVLPLASLGVVGVAAPDGGAALARGLVGQAATWHSSRDLAIAVLTHRPEEWEWVRWLPHARAADGQPLVAADDTQAVARVAELAAMAASRDHDEEARRRRVVVVLDDARRLRSLPGVAELLADGPARGISFLCLGDDDRALPQECRGVASVEGATLSLRVDGLPTVCDVVADLPSVEWAERVARALAPLYDAGVDVDGTGRALPDRVRWTEAAALPLGPDAAAGVAARWAAGPTMSVPIGVGADGPLHIDLRRDGPHALLAGTTGAGKSELLRTLVAGLAAGNRPDQLTFVLMDYKGGAAFGRCADLPHTVGLVTDLDHDLTERALVSLSAELRRREALLADAGASDIDDYTAVVATDRHLPPLPRLVLVVDEFATLAEELPDFVGGLVGIAQRGRSLGVHLVLATQRPEGVVSNDIRANTNLRICLGVTRDGESRDVIDAPDAARISRRTPGRGYLRTGHGDLTVFQTAQVTGATPGRDDGVHAAVVPFADLGAAPVRAGEPAAGEDDLDRLVAACRTAAVRLGVTAAPSPWLPPLPTRMTADELSDGGSIAYAAVDRPEQQSRDVLDLDLDRDAHLLVVGGARSGRTSTLRTLAVQAARRFDVADLHLYAADAGGGGLLSLARLPHTGGVVTLGETERLDRLFSLLSQEVTDRLGQLSARGVASVAELRAAGEPLPHLMLLIDRWDAMQATLQDVEGGRLLDVAMRLLTDGPAAGLHVVVTADRSGLVGRLAAAIDDKLVLRLADPGDYALVGIAAAKAPSSPPPGRGIVARTQSVAQVALLAGSGTGADEVAQVERIAATLATGAARVPVGARPRRVDPMPTLVRLPDISTTGPTRDGWVTLGVGGLGPDPIAMDLAECGTFTVAGPRRTGRSIALAAIAGQLRAQGRTVIGVAPRRSPLGDHVHDVVADVTDAGRLAALVDSAPAGFAVIADDVELLTDTPVGDVVERLAARIHDSAGIVVVAGLLDDLAVAFRGPGAVARRSRAGIVLAPSGPHDGEVLGARLPRAATGHSLPPGRGVLVGAGTATTVQVATPSPAHRGSAARDPGKDDIERLFDRLEVEMAANEQPQDLPHDVPEPSTWATGDEPATQRQESYLATLARDAGEEVPDDLTKAEASEQIDALREETGRS